MGMGASDERALGFLRDVAVGCQRCPLAQTRRQVVFGEGPAAAELLIVGEAPGADEDRLGRPFQGRAGRALDQLLASRGLDRGASYITNAALCRPAPGAAPTPVEVEACAPYLDLTLALVRPRVILTLGVVPTHRLLGPVGSVAALRGRAHNVDGALVVPTWHPSGWNRAPARRSEAAADLELAARLLSGDARA